MESRSSADKESGIQYPESGIDSVESRIQNGASYDIARGLKNIISNCNQFLFCF